MRVLGGGIPRGERAHGGRLRENSAAVGFCHKNGYFVAEEVLTRLGNGAVPEDYLMRKEIEN